MGTNKRHANTFQYLLRNVPAASWRGATRRAELEGVSLRAVILAAIRAYADGTLQLHAKRTRKAQPEIGELEIVMRGEAS